jgi:hypothetical protein
VDHLTVPVLYLKMPVNQKNVAFKKKLITKNILVCYVTLLTGVNEKIYIPRTETIHLKISDFQVSENIHWINLYYEIMQPSVICR